MRFVDLERYEAVKKHLNKRMAVFAAVVTGILLFFFVVGISFGGAILTMLIGGVLIFCLIYPLLRMTSNGAARKRQKLDVQIPYVDVTYMNELGILILANDAIVYKALNVGARYPEIVLPIDEDLFMAIGEYKRRPLDKYRHGEFQKCHMTFRQMPHGMVRQFSFFNIDNCIDAIEQRLNEVSVFNAAKYQ